MNIKRIAIIGECMVELQQQGDLLKQSFGGDTLNTAIYLSRRTRDAGVTTAYVTGLGNDSFSRTMLNAWQQEQIDTELVHISASKKPGLYAIETDDSGERTFHYWRSDAAARFWLEERDPEDVLDNLCQFDLIYLSGISLAILPPDSRVRLFDILAQCKAHGVRIAFDNNYRPALWDSVEAAQQAYHQVLSLTDIAFLTFDDEVALWGDDNEAQAIARTQDLGVQEIAIKRGAEPCLVVADGEQVQVAANKIARIVDTTAAGDSFSAGYLGKRILGGTAPESAAAGHTLAGQVIQHQGAIIPASAMPTF